MKLGRICIAVCASALAGCAAKTPAPPPAPASVPPPKAAQPLSGNVGEETLTATATVQKVNLKNRHVTLKGSDGKTFTIVAGDEVRNLKQVKKGDVVRVTYHESVAYQVNKAGTAKPGVSESTDVSRAKLGDKPGASVTNTVSVRMTIAAISKPTSEVTLRGPQGKTVQVKVRDPSKLDQVQVGDVVDITYTEAIAVAVEKPGS